MPYKVHLTYFRPTGQFLAAVETTAIKHASLTEIWNEVHELRSIGRLPGLRPNAGRDLVIIVDVPDHPQHEQHLVMPPFVDEDDVTPIRGPTGEPFEDRPRTTTRDIVKIDPDDEITPVDGLIPKPRGV